MRYLFILCLFMAGCSIDMRPYNLYVDSAPKINVEQMSCHPDSMINHRVLCDPQLHI